MQDLIDRVVQNVGIDPSVAKPAIGVVLQLLKSVLPAETINSLVSAVPGAEQLMASADESSGGGGGGLGGMLGGALGSLTAGGGGALMETLGKMQGLGLDIGQSKSVGTEVLGFLKENAPADVNQAIEEKLPALGL